MDYRQLAEELFHAISKSRRPPFRKMPMDVSHGEMGILMYLTHNRNGSSAGELSKRLQITTGRVATALNGLERKQLIERRNDETDKRKVLVYITEEGRAFALRRHEQAKRDMEQLLRELGEHDAKEFVRILKRIYENRRDEEKDYDC